MANPIPHEVFDHIHQMPEFHRPGFLIAAGAIAAAGAGIELYKNRADNNSQQNAIQLADPIEGERALSGLNRARRFKRAGFYAGLAVSSLVIAHFSDPYSETVKTHGGATVVVDASYAADAPIGTESDSPSRLQAGLEASLDSANDKDIPFTFVVEGSEAKVADRTPAKGKKLDRTRQLLGKIITPTLRNGENLAAGVEIAAPSTETNNVIIIASDVNQAEQERIQAVNKALKQNGKGEVSAVVVGSGKETYTVGTESLSANVDPGAFESILGKKNVFEAHSTEDVKKSINKIVSQKVINHEEHSSDIFKDLAMLFGVLGATVAMRNRLAGVFKLSKSKEIK